MITLKEYLEVINYKITETSEYLWNSYGENAMSMDSWDGDQDGYSVNCVFDKINQTVYEMSAHDYKKNKSYRWIHPDYIESHKEECERNNVDFNEAWDDIKYVTLELAEDILYKANAIVNDEDYDERVMIELELDNDLIYNLMKIAHERDITLNKLVEDIIAKSI